MPSARALIGSANFTAAAGLLVIFAGLVAQGSNDAATAALLSAALLAVLLVRAIFSPSQELAGPFKANWLSVLAALALLGWALVTAAPALTHALAPGLATHWAHALAGELGQSPAAISLSPYRTLEGAAALLAPCAAFLIGALACAHAPRKDSAGRWLSLFTILYALYALAVFLQGRTAHPQVRLDVQISSANAAATLFGMLALFAAALIVRASSGRLDEHGARPLPRAMKWAAPALKAPVSLTALILALACALLTASRGGIASIVVSFVMFGAILAAQALTPGPARAGTSPRRALVLAPALIIIAIAGALFLRGGDALLDRLNLVNNDIETRSDMLAAHWKIFLERPILGHGMNTYHELNGLAATPANWSALRGSGSVHNIFVQGAEEVGLVGMALFALMLATPLWRALMGVFLGRSGREWSGAILAATTLCFLHGLVDFGLQVPAIAALFAFTLGAFAGAPTAARRSGAA